MNRKEIIDDILKGRFQCDSCLRLITEEDTESYTERHGPQSHQVETLRCTTCCKSNYQDLTAELLDAELLRILELLDTDAAISQPEVDNLAQVTLIVEDFLDV